MRIAACNPGWIDLPASGFIAPAEIAVNVVDQELLDALVQRLNRRMAFDLSVSERTLYVSMGEETLTGAVESRRLAS